MTRPAFRRTARILPAAACAAAAAAFTVGPLAQTGTGQLSGTVFDARQKGAAGLSVAAVPDDGGFLHGTCTDQDGRYDFRGLPSGSYSILVSGPAGVLRKDGIRLRPLFRSIVDFSLAADAAVSGLPTLIGRPGGASAPASGAARPPAGAPDGASSTAPGPAPPQNGRAGEEAAVPDPGTPAVA
ncbi:MAG TPA: carboxypeptidase-like regulatory domain-containing protein, partial [Candidatus Polarisedimenticolia bacterium]|nr:carboxypeptidase-like regulatory domain-containing protein [Candidatus Polarisedimenticolia bacterium]